VAQDTGFYLIGLRNIVQYNFNHFFKQSNLYLNILNNHIGPMVYGPLKILLIVFLYNAFIFSLRRHILLKYI